MSFTNLAGLSGLGFVLVGITINVIYLRAGLPLPGSRQSLEAGTRAFATISTALKRPSVLAPATWLRITVFAAGLLSALWHGGLGPGTWWASPECSCRMRRSCVARRCALASLRLPPTTAAQRLVCGAQASSCSASTSSSWSRRGLCFTVAGVSARLIPGSDTPAPPCCFSPPRPARTTLTALTGSHWPA